jgi:hypothetical protein
METAFHQEKKSARSVFDAALKQVRWLDSYQGPLVERRVVFHTQPAKAQFVKSFYITERNLIYLDTCLRSPFEAVREAASRANHRVERVIETAMLQLDELTKMQVEKAQKTGLKQVTRPGSGDEGVVYIMAPLANAYLDAIARLDDLSMAIDTLWVAHVYSDEDRIKQAMEGRKFLDQVYEASSAGYHEVSRVYEETARGARH